MQNIGFYSEDELMDLLQEGAIDMVDFLRYSPQWHEPFTDFCLERGISQNHEAAVLFLAYMELEEVASYNYNLYSDDYDLECQDLVDALGDDDLSFLN